MLRVVGILLAATAWAGAAAAAGPEDAQGLAASEILERAFSNLYDCDLRAVLTLTLRTGHGEESIRQAEIARKRIRGRLQSYGRFLEPAWMRGTAVLVLDHGGGSSEHFLFLPEQRRVRRVTSVQRSDAFLGSDLWYEDLERRDLAQYSIGGMSEKLLGGEPAYAILATPKQESRYQRVEFDVARSDFLLLKSSFFRGDAELPFKTIESERRSALVSEGHVLPTVLLVRNPLRGTTTEARFEGLEMNPELSESLFTTVALEAGRRIPGLRDGEP
ncbi:MAG: outer membrane lipoprotein-sorting protein [Vicinamibacteria bacterium]